MLADPAHQPPNVLNYYQIIRETLELALPMTGARVLSMARNFIGNVMLARISNNALSAGALISSMQDFFLQTGSGFMNASGNVLSRAKSRGDLSATGAIFRESQLLAVITSIPTMLMLYYANTFFSVLNQPAELDDIVESYFHFSIMATVPYYLLVSSQRFAYAIKQQNLPFYVSLMGLPVFAAAAYPLMFGAGRIPAQGVKGLAYAEIIRAWFSFLMLEFFLFCNKAIKPYSIYSVNLIKNIAYLKELFSIGWPTVVQTGTELSSLLAITLLNGTLGLDALAAKQIATSYMFFILVPSISLSQSVGMLVSKSVGENNLTNMQRFGYVSLLIAALIPTLLLIACVIYPLMFIMPFINVNDSANKEIVALAKPLLMLTFAGQIFDVTRNLLIGALNGLYDTKFPMVVSAVSAWGVGVSLGYYLGLVKGFGVEGLIGGYNLGLVLGAIVLFTRWYSKSQHLPPPTDASERSSIFKCRASFCFRANSGPAKNDLTMGLLGAAYEAGVESYEVTSQHLSVLGPSLNR